MKSAPRLRLAAFDMDGTLLDSASAIVTGVMACWEACGFPLPEPDEVRRIIGLPWEESVQALLPGAGEAEFARIREYHAAVARGERTRPPREQALFPGVVPMLDRVAEAGYLLAIITSRSSGRLTELLDAEGLTARFVCLKCADHGPGKPSPYLMLQALEETGVDRCDAVMVGDTTFDMLMARSAGTPAIGVSWGVHPAHELRAAGADRIVETIEELPPVIDRLTAE